MAKRLVIKRKGSNGKKTIRAKKLGPVKIKKSPGKSNKALTKKEAIKKRLGKA